MEKLIITDELTYEVFSRLVSDQILLICVKNYTATQVRTILSDWIAESEDLHSCPHEIRTENEVKYIDYGVDSIGESYNITFGQAPDSKRHQLYYAIAKQYHKSIRRVCAPHLNPFDKFRLELDELWPHCVGLGNFEKQGKMAAGLGRVVRSGSDVLVSKNPHCDSLPREKSNLVHQLSVNIYLDLPESGGELEIWDVEPLKPEVIENLDPETLLRSNLPASTSFSPEKGDLVIFNTRKPHAVNSFLKGRRITLQSFIGIHTDNSISLWA